MCCIYYSLFSEFNWSSCRFGMRFEMTGIPTDMHNTAEKAWQAASG